MYEFKAGDIILYRGSSLLSKGIRFFMEQYRRKLKLPKRKLFNHAAMIIEVWGRLYVAEANGKGIEVRTIEEAYGKRMNTIKVITPKKSYTEKERKAISKIAASYAFNPTRYDFSNFIHQIKMILGTKIENGKVIQRWSGKKGKEAEKRLYCTEAVGTWANKVRANTFEDPWSINPLDVDLNKYYKTSYDGTV